MIRTTTRISDRKLKQYAALAAVERCEPRLCFSTFTVNTLSDAANSGAGLLTLRQAVTNANNNPGADTIAFSTTAFPGNKQNVIKLQQGELDITGNTTINGPGAAALSIDGNKASRVFHIAGGVTVSLNALTITNGAVTSPGGSLATGGGVLNSGTLNLTNVTVSNNTATGGDVSPSFGGAGGAASGGGIYSTGNLSLVNSVVTGNMTRGGVDYYGTDGASRGGGIYSAGPLTITGSTISSNVAASGQTNETLNGDGGESDGGGVYAASSLLISTSTFSNNIANGGDGRQTHSAFNSGAPGNGGAVFAAGTANFKSDTFTSNHAIGGNNGGGGGDGSPGSGGAIFSSGSVVMTSSTLTGNTAEGGAGAYDDSGAGGNASGGAMAAQASLNISSSTIVSNKALGGTGQPNGNETGASAWGGGIYSILSLALTGSTVSGNSAVASQTGYGGGSYGGSGGVGEGGGVYIAGSAVILNSTLAANNTTGGVGLSNGGVGGVGYGGAIYNNAALTLTNSTLTANSAVGGAGGSSYYSNGGSGRDGSGSAIFSVNSVTVNDSTITGNTTAGGAGGSSGSGYSGNGAGSGSAAVRIAVAQGTDTINNTIVSGNLADGSTENDLLGGFNPTTSGNNLVGTSDSLANGVDGNIVGVNNPLLSPLGNYGGPTQTMLPLYNSPAAGAGSNSLVPGGVTTDQRGYSRIFGSHVDIGADELQAAVVSGSIFDDQNGDGIRQTGEPALSGVTVYADLSNAGFFKSGDPTGMTNSSGNYTLYGVPEGTVIIRQIVPGSYRQSYPIGAAGNQVRVTPTGVTGALFADSTRLYISGSVTLNGAGLTGVLVYADLNNDGKFESSENNKTTAVGGGYAFQSLTPGTYTFRVVPPAGTVISGNSAVTVTLGSGGIDQNVSFSLANQTNQKLTGTVIGTAGSYNNDGNTIAKVFDGNLATFFDAPTNAGNYAGLDLGTADIITQISYAPRPSYASRMVGGIFQGSNSADFSSGVANLYTVTSAPAQGVLTTVPITNYNAFRYVRYLAPAGSFGNVAEVQFFGSAPTVGATLRSGGVLVVNGTSGADTINIQINNEDTVNSDTVVATVNGVSQSFNLTDVLQIIVNAGAGNDTVTATGIDYGPDDKTGHGYEAFVINGGDGNDSLTVNVDHLQATPGESMLIDGGAGDDSLYVSGPLAATLVGGDGNDIFSSNGNPDGLVETIFGGDGNDSVWADGNTYLTAYDGGSGVNTLDYTRGFFDTSLNNETVDLNKFVNVHNVILGGDARTVTGTPGNDTITAPDAGSSDVSIVGNGGNDTISINDGNSVYVDASVSTASNISVNNSSAVTIIGGNGNDTISVLVASEVSVVGGAGNDHIVVSGEPADATANDPHSAYVSGGTGNDTIYGFAEDATVDGGDGNDTVNFGGSTSLQLDGGAGNDTLTGEGGKLLINGGDGNDNISTVGIEADQYAYVSASVNGGNGNDTITSLDGDITTINGGAGTDTAFVDPGDIVTNVEFVNPGQGHTKLTGTIIGTPGSYNNQGNTISKVFDGNLTNYFDAPVASGAWAGLDLGAAKVVTQVKYAPRVGFASRMVGGQIQASNTADFSSGVVTLYTIASAPASGVFTTQALSNTAGYRYYRYIGPTNGSCNVAELEFDG